MRELIIHAGPGKTGSSTIQAFLFANASRLAEAGIYVPARTLEDLKGNHTHLMWELRSGPLSRTPGKLPLAEELAAQDFPQKVILSYEGYSGVIGKPAFRTELAAYAERLGYRVGVLSYVRPQMTLINSVYVQQAKSLQPQKPFAAVLDDWLTATDKWNYQQRYDRYCDGRLPPAQFVPFTASLAHDWLCVDFLQRAGVPPETIARCEPVVRQNEGIGPKALAAMRDIAARSADVVAAADANAVSDVASQLRQLLAAKGWTAGKFNGLMVEDKHRLRAVYARSNQRFARFAWNTEWRTVFGADESNFLAQPRNVYEPAADDPAQRTEFNDFCRKGAAFVREMLAGR